MKMQKQIEPQRAKDAKGTQRTIHGRSKLLPNANASLRFLCAHRGSLSCEALAKQDAVTVFNSLNGEIR
jgi:hypothetical protein